MIAVEAADLVVWPGPTRGAGGQIEVPHQPAITGIHGIKAALAALLVIHIHPEEHQTIGHNGRGLHFVPFAL
jgi:hypothetical protein